MRLRKRGKRRSPPEESPARPGAGERILVVEDVEVNRMLLALLLETLGDAPCVVEGGVDALEFLNGPEGGEVAVTFLDYCMPGIDGLGTTRCIRSHPGFPERLRAIPIVAMTAGVIEAERDSYRQAGMDDELAKPLRKDELAATLARWWPG